MRAISEADLPKKPGRTEFQRGQLTRSSTGELSVRTTGAQGSGILSSMTEADCMIILSNDQGTVRTGDMVDVVLFDGLI